MIVDKDILSKSKDLFDDMVTSNGFTSRPPVQEADTIFLLMLIAELQLKVEKLLESKGCY